MIGEPLPRATLEPLMAVCFPVRWSESPSSTPRGANVCLITTSVSITANTELLLQTSEGELIRWVTICFLEVVSCGFQNHDRQPSSCQFDWGLQCADTGSPQGVLGMFVCLSCHSCLQWPLLLKSKIHLLSRSGLLNRYYYHISWWYDMSLMPCDRSVTSNVLNVMGLTGHMICPQCYVTGWSHNRIKTVRLALMQSGVH